MEEGGGGGARRGRERVRVRMTTCGGGWEGCHGQGKIQGETKEGEEDCRKVKTKWYTCMHIYTHIASVSICTFILLVKQVNRVESDDEEDESYDKRYTQFTTRNLLALLVQNLGKRGARSLLALLVQKCQCSLRLSACGRSTRCTAREEEEDEWVGEEEETAGVGVGEEEVVGAVEKEQEEEQEVWVQG